MVTRDNLSSASHGPKFTAFIILALPLVAVTLLNITSTTAILSALFTAPDWVSTLLAAYRQGICEPFIELFLYVYPGSWPALPWWVLDYYFVTLGLMIGINILEYLATGISSFQIAFRQDRKEGNFTNFLGRCIFLSMYFVSSFFIVPIGLLVLMWELPRAWERTSMLTLGYCLGILVVSGILTFFGSLPRLI